jgi:hypothetical protein
MRRVPAAIEVTGHTTAATALSPGPAIGIE